MKFRLDVKKIRYMMIEKGITISDIACYGCVTRQAVSAVLNGRSLGKTCVLPTICKLLKVSIQDIVIDKD